MSRPSLIEYIIALIDLYKNASKSEKTKLLNQAEKLTGKSRRTVQRYLAKNKDQLNCQIKIHGRGRSPIYEPDELLPHIRHLWKAMDMPSAERMKEALHKWLPSYDVLTLTEELREKLLSMSHNTLNRLLHTLRKETKANRGLSTTTSALRVFKTKVPLNTLDQKITRPGFTQADTVAHCGTTTAGQYINSITLTDIFSGWTLNYAIESKRAIYVRRAFVHIKQGLPFELLAVNTDSGSEFINRPMIQFMNLPFGGKAITFTRSRPYRKNDNCYVEQKNYTHVRQLFGYYRIEDLTLAPLMNEIYEVWNLLHNFFLPTQKLIEKNRVGAKIFKKHDIPQTPADRLLKSLSLTKKQKFNLEEKFKTLNPFYLSKLLEQKLKIFFYQHNQNKQPILYKEAA